MRNIAEEQTDGPIHQRDSLLLHQVPKSAWRGPHTTQRLAPSEEHHDLPFAKAHPAPGSIDSRRCSIFLTEASHRRWRRGTFLRRSLSVRAAYDGRRGQAGGAPGPQNGAERILSANLVATRDRSENPIAHADHPHTRVAQKREGFAAFSIWRVPDDCIRLSFEKILREEISFDFVPLKKDRGGHKTVSPQLSPHLRDEPAIVNERGKAKNRNRQPHHSADNKMSIILAAVENRARSTDSSYQPFFFEEKEDTTDHRDR
ncbi:MAG: hypothetical protein ABI233_12265 [Chthoniobacterales bacterium]